MACWVFLLVVFVWGGEGGGGGSWGGGGEGTIFSGMLLVFIYIILTSVSF